MAFFTAAQTDPNTTPTPASGYATLVVSPDGQLLIKDSAGVLRAFVSAVSNGDLLEGLPITPNTDVSFPGTGLIGHAGGKATSVDPSQFAEWTPTLIAANETFTVPENRQVLFALPITIEEDGILEINGELIEV